MSGHGESGSPGVAGIADPISGRERVATLVISGPPQAVSAFIESGVVEANGLTAIVSFRPHGFSETQAQFGESAAPFEITGGGWNVLAQPGFRSPSLAFEIADVAADDVEAGVQDVIEQPAWDIDMQLGMLQTAVRSAAGKAKAAADIAETRGDEIDAMLSRIANALHRGASA